MLLERNADANIVSSIGSTALMTAAVRTIPVTFGRPLLRWRLKKCSCRQANGYSALTTMLLEKGGAQIDFAQPATGGTAYHQACEQGCADCVEALVRGGCDINYRVRRMIPPLGIWIASFQECQQ